MSAICPQVLLDQLIALFPGFALQWDDPGNCFREEDGSFTFCGAFAEFSSYFRENYEQFPRTQLAALGTFLSECMAVRHSDLDVAAATCFLENVAGERFSADFKGYLRGEPLAFYSQWEG